MNRTFKRALSSILAFVMVMSCVMVMNVSTAFAEPTVNKYEVYYNSTPTVDKGFTGGAITNKSTSALNLSTLGISKLDGSELSGTDTIKLNSTGIVNFKVVGTGKLTAYFGIKKDTTKNASIKLISGHTTSGSQYGETSETATPSDVAFKKYEVTGIPAGDYSIMRADNECVLAYALLEDEVSDTAKEYNLSGKCNLKSTKITVGEDETTTDESGNWKISKTVDGGAAPWNAGDSLTVKCSQYQDTTTSVSGSDTTFTASDITLTPISMQALEPGEYGGELIGAGLPYFDIASIYTEDSSLMDNTTIESIDTKVYGNFSFKLDKPAIVTINAKSGGSGDVSFKLTDESGTAKVEGTVYGKTSDNENKEKALDFVTEVLPAGTYKLVGPTSGSALTVLSITVDAENEIKGVAYGDNYVVFGISAANAAKYNSYEIVGGTAEGGNTVYTGVEFADGTKTVSEIPGIDTEYCVAYKFDNVDGNLDALVKAVKLSLK